MNEELRKLLFDLSNGICDTANMVMAIFISKIFAEAIKHKIKIDGGQERSMTLNETLEFFAIAFDTFAQQIKEKTNNESNND